MGGNWFFHYYQQVLPPVGERGHAELELGLAHRLGVLEDVLMGDLDQHSAPGPDGGGRTAVTGREQGAGRRRGTAQELPSRRALRHGVEILRAACGPSRASPAPD